MKNNMHTDKELREEFLSKWSKTFDAGVPYWPDREAIADWWLSKLSLQKQKIIEVIKSEITELETWSKVTKSEQDKKEYQFAIFVLKKVLSPHIIKEIQ